MTEYVYRIRGELMALRAFSTAIARVLVPPEKMPQIIEYLEHVASHPPPPSPGNPVDKGQVHFRDSINRLISGLQRSWTTH